jgi:Cation transporter/ATPase, N-terminus
VPSIDGPVWHALSADRVLQAERVDGQHGLSSAEVVSRARQFGPNAFDAGKVESRWRAFVRQYADPMQIVLLVAGIVSLFLKEFETGVVLILLTLFNAVLGLHQEGKAAAAVSGSSASAWPRRSSWSQKSAKQYSGVPPLRPFRPGGPSRRRRRLPRERRAAKRRQDSPSTGRWNHPRKGTARRSNRIWKPARTRREQAAVMSRSAS